MGVYINSLLIPINDTFSFPNACKPMKFQAVKQTGWLWLNPEQCSPPVNIQQNTFGKCIVSGTKV